MLNMAFLLCIHQENFDSPINFSVLIAISDNGYYLISTKFSI